MREARKVCNCSYCGHNIYEGDKIIKVGTEVFHTDCCEEDTAHFDDGFADHMDRERDDRVAFEQNVNRFAVEMGDGDLDEM
jgi:hypothetical protein